MVSKLLLKQGINYKDVSGYKLVIWGAECTRSLSAKLQLDDIDMVVDENPDVCGNAICLYGRNYTVTSPESICVFANERAIVLIGSNLSIKGISEKIELFWGENKEYYIVKSDDLYGYYESIEELLLSDPIMLKKIVDGNISKKIYDFIIKINKIIEDNTENFSKIYIPIREGARISFIVSDKDFHPQNVMHFPVLSDREENNVYGVQALSQTFELKEKLHFDDSIKLYEDKAGFELERFGNVIEDWDNTELVRRVVSILREVHNTDISTDIVRDPWKKLLAVENHIRERSVNFPWELSEKIHKELSEEIRRYKPKLCHGDIICENVLSFNDEPVLIDWEWVGLSDPMFDLCRLSTSLKYSGFNDVINKDMVLEMYLDRVPTAEEKRHYEAMIAYDEYMRYCSYLLTGANRDKYIEKMVTKKIENANMLNMIIESWIHIIGDDEKSRKISTLWEEWGALDIADMICTRFSSYKNVFATHILDAKLLSLNNRITKRIAFYYKKYGQGGVERVISLLIPLFLKAGYGVVLITEVPEEKNDFTLPNGVKRYVIPSKNDIDAGRIRYRERGKRLLDIYEKESIDTVCYEESSSRYLMYDLIVTKSAGIKFIVSKHELFSQHFVFNRDILTDEMTSYPLADAITVLSKEEETFWRTLGVKSYLIPNPLTLEKTANYRYNCDADEIVWVGRLDRNQKQYQEIVPIIKEVVKSVPNIIINIYGAPETYKDLYLLEHQIKEEGLEKNIRYMGYSNSIEDIFSNASMMLMTSAYESSPMVILESKQFGVPIVMYSMPYIEILKDGKGYIAVNQGDSTAASGAVVQLIKNREYRIRLSEEASSSLETYSDDYVMEQWGNLLSGNISCEIDTGTVYEKILRTMTFHMSLGCAKYDELAKNNRKLIEDKKIETIKRIQNERELKIALYPFGNLGRKLHAKLTNNQIDISLIVDNAGYVDGHEVVTLKDLKGINVDEYLFVITSNNMKYYDEIRSDLRGIVSERNIFDWYPADEV